MGDDSSPLHGDDFVWGCAEVAPSITEELEYLIKGMPLRSLFRSSLVFGELRPEL
ncbi:MAG: hypothetical protein ACFNOQ_02020 [Porphyromonas sp.]